MLPATAGQSPCGASLALTEGPMTATASALPASLAPARPTWTTFLCGAMQGIGGGLGWSLLPGLMPIMAVDLHISHAMGGLVWGAAALGIAVAAPVGGAAVDRLGPRRVAGIAMLFGALACAGRALCQDGPQLVAAMFVFGLHIGFVAPAIPKALAGHVPLQRLGRANGIALVCYTFGTALTIWLGRTVLVPAVGGWRQAMVLAGAAMAAVGILWLATARDRIALSRHAGLGDVFRLGRNTQLLRVAAMQFLMFGGYLALLGVLPRLLTEQGLAPAEIGAAVALWLVAAGCANLAGPWLSDKIGRRRPLILCGSVVATVALAALALAPAQGAGALLALSALGGGAFAPLLLALPLEIEGVGPTRAGAAMGLLMLVGQAGGFLLPVIVGAVAQSSGFGGALGVLAVAHGLLLVPALGLIETGRAVRTTPGAVPSAA